MHVPRGHSASIPPHSSDTGFVGPARPPNTQASPKAMRKHDAQALYLRGGLTIQNHNEKKTEQGVISKKQASDFVKYPIMG